MKKFFILLIINLIYFSLFAQKPQVSAGKLDFYENFPSKLVKPRNIAVWLPENYSPKKKYAVLYMHDGQNLFDSTITFNKQEWGIDETISKLQKEGIIKECIVVGIWNTTYRRQEYYPAKAFYNIPKHWQDSLLIDMGADKKTQPLSDNYLSFIVSELKPFIDKNYSTKTNRKNTFISGSSMGGLISLYAICEYPKIFGGAACISTHWAGSVYRNKPEIANGFIEYMKKYLPSPKTHKIYFDYGTETLDAWYKPYQLLADEVMKQKGFNTKNWMTKEFVGAEHNEKSWQERFDIPARFILKK
ncbi:MAG: alpha/beta hydrolase-fold protein [Flammeovirgaceae bacterium]